MGEISLRLMVLATYWQEADGLLKAVLGIHFFKRKTKPRINANCKVGDTSPE